MDVQERTSLTYRDGERVLPRYPHGRPTAPTAGRCSMRASGEHPAFRRAAGGALVCSACGRVKR